MKQESYLVEGPLEPVFIQKSLSELQSLENAGANAFFLGRVRADVSGESKTISIEYSAYADMVEKAALEIRNSLFNKYDDLISIGIWHSTGVVSVGEVSLLVLIASGHRKQAFAALEECVELIKEKLPVWKKENFSDGSHHWTNS